MPRSRREHSTKAVGFMLRSTTDAIFSLHKWWTTPENTIRSAISSPLNQQKAFYRVPRQVWLSFQGKNAPEKYVRHMQVQKRDGKKCTIALANHVEGDSRTPSMFPGRDTPIWKKLQNMKRRNVLVIFLFTDDSLSCNIENAPPTLGDWKAAY